MLKKKAVVQIYYIMKACIGDFPESWRQANSIPVLKANKRGTDSGSYNLFRLLPALGKLLERLVNDRLRNYDH